MNIRFTLNTEQVHVDAMPHERLSTVLRRCFHLPSIKGSHGHGENGASTILFNGEAVSAYIIPFFLAHETQIVTLDFFQKTKRGRWIVACFAQHHISFCGYCDAGKILTAESLLQRNSVPNEEEVRHAFSGMQCRYTDINALIRALQRMPACHEFS